MWVRSTGFEWSFPESRFSTRILPDSRFMKEFDVICPTKPDPPDVVARRASRKNNSMNGDERVNSR